MLRPLLVLIAALVGMPSALAGNTDIRRTGPETVDIGARQRCVCALRSPARLVRYHRYARHYRSAGLYPIGFDPLPYRFGYYPKPYRYHDRIAIVTVRPARYYR